MKKMLFISNISNQITNFSIPSIEAAHLLGYEFHMAANYSGFTGDASKYNVILHHIDLVRNPFSFKNIKAFKQMLALLKRERFDVIHCNTPIGGILGRLCGKIAKVPKVIYTAHGFHFYKGAPFINCTVYKWAEMWMAHYTNVILTINKEDYEAAQKFKLRKGGKVYYIPGVGVGTKNYQPKGINKQKYRKKLGIPLSATVVVSVGDLNKNKNHEVVIKALAKLNDPLIYYVICGTGELYNYLKALAMQLHVQEQIKLLGFRSDVKEIYSTSDIFALPSMREGLSRSLMEAMSMGMPCVVSKIRGNLDLIKDGKGGYLCEPGDVDVFAKAIMKLTGSAECRSQMGLCNKEIIMQFDEENIKKEMQTIYTEVLLNEHKGNYSTNIIFNWKHG